MEGLVMTKAPRFLGCEECGNDSVPNPWPDPEIKEVTCIKCDTIHEIEWIDDVEYN
jgi:hypothetical protein